MTTPRSPRGRKADAVTNDCIRCAGSGAGWHALSECTYARKCPCKKRVMFTVYRRYFDAIKAGTKNVEYRQYKPPWTAYLVNPPAEAVFVCGRDRLTRRIHDVVATPSTQTIEFHLAVEP